MRFLAVLMTVLLMIGASFDASALTCSGKAMQQAAQPIALHAPDDSMHQAPVAAHHGMHGLAMADAPCHEPMSPMDESDMSSMDCCCSLLAHAAVFPVPAPELSWRTPQDWARPMPVAARTYKPGLEKPPPRA